MSERMCVANSANKFVNSAFSALCSQLFVCMFVHVCMPALLWRNQARKNFICSSVCAVHHHFVYIYFSVFQFLIFFFFFLVFAFLSSIGMISSALMWRGARMNQNEVGTPNIVPNFAILIYL